MFSIIFGQNISVPPCPYCVKQQYVIEKLNISYNLKVANGIVDWKLFALHFGSRYSTETENGHDLFLFLHPAFICSSILMSTVLYEQLDMAVAK